MMMMMVRVMRVRTNMVMTKSNRSVLSSFNFSASISHPTFHHISDNVVNYYIVLLRVELSVLFLCYFINQNYITEAFIQSDPLNNIF